MVSGARVSTKCRDPKPTKLVIGPPTSSASLLAFAPPLTSYCQSLQTPVYSSDVKDSSDCQSAPRTSACDPLLSSIVSPYATADLLDTKPSSTPPPPPLPVDLSAFEFPRKNLKFVEMLGEGQFGEVNDDAESHLEGTVCYSSLVSRFRLSNRSKEAKLCNKKTFCLTNTKIFC